MRRAGLWFALAAVGALMLIGAPSALAATGCVYSGGGWICAGEQPPSEPGEIPTVEPLPVVTVEPVGVTDGEVTGEITPAPDPAPEPVEPAPAPVPPVQSVCD